VRTDVQSALSSQLNLSVHHPCGRTYSAIGRRWRAHESRNMVRCTVSRLECGRRISQGSRLIRDRDPGRGEAFWHARAARVIANSSMPMSDRTEENPACAPSWLGRPPSRESSRGRAAARTFTKRRCGSQCAELGVTSGVPGRAATAGDTIPRRSRGSFGSAAAFCLKPFFGHHPQPQPADVCPPPRAPEQVHDLARAFEDEVMSAIAQMRSIAIGVSPRPASEASVS